MRDKTKDVKMWKYTRQELAHHNLILHGTILPEFLESIVPLDKYRRVSVDSDKSMVYECDTQHYITKGAATIVIKDGRKFKVGKGDCICIDRGVSCSWIIHRTVKMRIRQF